MALKTAGLIIQCLRRTTKWYVMLVLLGFIHVNSRRIVYFSGRAG
jgi:hypothetical protein